MISSFQAISIRKKSFGRKNDKINMHPSSTVQISLPSNIFIDFLGELAQVS